jgi:hypothetical protein
MLPRIRKEPAATGRRRHETTRIVPPFLPASNGHSANFGYPEAEWVGRHDSHPMIVGANFGGIQKWNAPAGGGLLPGLLSGIASFRGAPHSHKLEITNMVQETCKCRDPSIIEWQRAVQRMRLNTE